MPRGHRTTLSQPYDSSQLFPTAKLILTCAYPTPTKYLSDWLALIHLQKESVSDKREMLLLLMDEQQRYRAFRFVLVLDTATASRHALVPGADAYQWSS
jgi:hypothetical protein